MKKCIAFLLVAVMGIGYSAQSQAGFKIGPRIGLNVNNLTMNSKLFDAANQCGFTGGVQAEYMLPMINLGVDLSLMYTYMDTKVELDKTDKRVGDFGKNFIDIPLNIKYKIGLPVVGKVFAPYVFTGPAVSFRLDGEDSVFKSAKSQWVWNFGLGLEFVQHLQIGASYGVGMNNVAKHIDVAGISFDTKKMKAHNNYWTVTAAWLF